MGQPVVGIFDSCDSLQVIEHWRSTSPGKLLWSSRLREVSFTQFSSRSRNDLPEVFWAKGQLMAPVCGAGRFGGKPERWCAIFVMNSFRSWRLPERPSTRRLKQLRPSLRGPDTVKSVGRAAPASRRRTRRSLPTTFKRPRFASPPQPGLRSRARSMMKRSLRKWS